MAAARLIFGFKKAGRTAKVIAALLFFGFVCATAGASALQRKQCTMLKYLTGGGAAEQKPKTDEEEGNCHSGALPCSFLSLNVNGLKTRVEQADGAWLTGIGKLVEQLDPDVIGMQEVKLTAKAPAGAKKGDGRPRQRNQPWDNDKQLDWQLVQKKMLNKEPWCRYMRRFSCADWRYAGTLTLFKKGLRKPEQFFYNLDLEDGRHDDNGRYTPLRCPSPSCAHALPAHRGNCLSDVSDQMVNTSHLQLYSPLSPLAPISSTRTSPSFPPRTVRPHHRHVFCHSLVSL